MAITCKSGRSGGRGEALDCWGRRVPRHSWVLNFLVLLFFPSLWRVKLFLFESQFLCCCGFRIKGSISEANKKGERKSPVYCCSCCCFFFSLGCQVYFRLSHSFFVVVVIFTSKEAALTPTKRVKDKAPCIAAPYS